MKYTLIIILWFTFHDSITVSTQRFATMQACQTVAAAIQHTKPVTARAETTCVETGE